MLRSHCLVLFTCLASLFGHPLHAQETKKILQTSTVDLGERSIIYQRVEPSKKTPASNVNPVPNAAAMPPVPSEAMIAKWNQWRETHETLSLSCMVYDTGVTEVRWWHNRAEYRVLSSIDFNNLRALGGFDADGHSYTVFMGIGNAMSASTLARLQAGGAILPASVTQPAPVLPASVLADIDKNGGSRYVIISAPEKSEAGAFNGIDDLHRYYDAHKEALIAAWKQNEADRIAHEQWLKEHPPFPQDTVIQFWPKKNSRYLGKEAQ